MSLAYINPLQARCVVTCTIEPGTLASDAITWGSSVDIGSKSGTGAFDSFRLDGDTEGTNYAGADSPGRSMVTEVTSFNGSISAISQADGTCPVAAALAGSDYARIKLLFRPRGAVSGGTYYAVICRIANGGLPVAAGKNINTFNFDQALSTIPAYIGSTLPAAFTGS